MSTVVPMVSVDQLPLEVLTKVFKCLKPHGDDAASVNSSRKTQLVAKVMADQASFHQLPLVCSKFNSVFAEHPELSDELNISKHVARTFVPSVLLWIHRWRSSISSFNAFSGEQHHELVLGALACPCSLLESICLVKPPAGAVCALPTFKSLRRCDLDGSKDEKDYLDLSALHQVFSLEELYLSTGRFSSVPSSGHLTTLWVSQSSVRFTGNLLEDISLKSLTMRHCAMSGLHDSGLAACKSLSSLCVIHAVFTAALQDDVLRVVKTLVASLPARMSELRCLTSLHMALVSSSSTTHFDLAWLYSLKAMKNLQLKVDGACEIGTDLTRLMEVTSMKITALATHHASYSVDWEAMQTLKRLELAGPISFDSRMLQLTSVRSLSCVELTRLCPCVTDSTVSVLARLMYRLAAKCPQVQVRVDKSLLTD